MPVTEEPTYRYDEKSHEPITLPEYLRPFFWDLEFQKLSVKDASYQIISRLMEHGDESAVRFLFETYGEEEMILVLKKCRSLSKRSRGFWSLFFGLEDESCTQKQYPTPYGNY